MRQLMWVWAAMVMFGTQVAGQGIEPARGSADRAGLMDAIRPHVEWQLGRPIEFVVYDLRMAGNVAFANLQPQRPGGGEIDITQTPMAARGVDLSFMDGTSLQVLYEKTGDTWVAVHWAIGPTDVWYVAEELCQAYSAVIGDVCAP
jgi:hypothetical protein